MLVKREIVTPELVRNIYGMLRAHYEEIDESGYDFSPSIDQFVHLEEMGLLRFFVARMGERVVGYSMLDGKKHARKGKERGINQMIYLIPEFRGKFLTLMGEATRALKKEGVKIIYSHAKITNDYGRVLAWMGYQEIEKIYLKKI